MLSAASSLPPRRVCVAPMLDWTDRHYRYFARHITQHTWLYTEMVTTGALLHGDVPRHLRFDSIESPIALQLGGSEPSDLARCAKLAADWGYDEVNLNVGCPSERVQRGAFGGWLMQEPTLVADCVKAMRDAVSLPITVKHRIGIDDTEHYGFVADFVGQVAEAGCETFIVHARKAILKGLSPKENREIPPLKYETVYQLKRDFSALEIIVNGGIKTTAEMAQHLEQVDGVMLGREAYHNPYLMATFDADFFGDATPPLSRHTVLEAMLPYLTRELAEGNKMHNITRHILGLFQGQTGARRFRQVLSDSKLLAEKRVALLLEACPSQS